jgi:hypothetical protein
MNKFKVLPPEAMKQIETPKPKKTIEKEVSIIFDRDYPLIRIPLDMSLELGIEKGDKMSIILKKDEKILELRLKK